MKDYIEESIDLFREKISTKVSSPAKKGLQNVDEGSTRLEKKDADIFHSIVAKQLWVGKWGRPNIEPSISFLCTRVTKSTKEDTAKLRQVFQYLKHTIDDKIIMGAERLIQLCTWVDAAYGVHPDLKSHTGGCVSSGYGWYIVSPASKI